MGFPGSVGERKACSPGRQGEGKPRPGSCNIYLIRIQPFAKMTVAPLPSPWHVYLIPKSFISCCNNSVRPSSSERGLYPHARLALALLTDGPLSMSCHLPLYFFVS